MTEVTKTQEIYKLTHRKTGSFLGAIVLNIISEIKQSQYNNRENIEAKLTIHLDFRDRNSERWDSSACSFHAGFNNSNWYDYHASVSTHTPSSHGGIDIRPFKIQGHRVGTLMMSKVVSWLKKFPSYEKVYPINFVPSGDKRIAEKFYKNAGIPIDGKTVTIGDLKIQQSWESNIERIHEDQFQDQVFELYREVEFLKHQKEILKKQCIEYGAHVYTHNPLKALTPLSIKPQLLELGYKNQIDISNEPYKSTHALISKYVKRNSEIEELNTEIERLLKLIKEYKQQTLPEKRLENFIKAFNGMLYVYAEKALIFPAIITFVFSFLYPEMRTYLVILLVMYYCYWTTVLFRFSRW